MVRCIIAAPESFLPKPCQETCPVGIGMNNRPLVAAGRDGHMFSFFSKVGAASVELDRLTTAVPGQPGSSPIF
jgi:hypothetical protein